MRHSQGWPLGPSRQNWTVRKVSLLTHVVKVLVVHLGRGRDSRERGRAAKWGQSRAGAADRGENRRFLAYVSGAVFCRSLLRRRRVHAFSAVAVALSCPTAAARRPETTTERNKNGVPQVHNLIITSIFKQDLQKLQYSTQRNWRMDNWRCMRRRLNVITSAQYVFGELNSEVFVPGGNFHDKICCQFPR